MRSSDKLPLVKPNFCLQNLERFSFVVFPLVNLISVCKTRRDFLRSLSSCKPVFCLQNLERFSSKSESGCFEVDPVPPFQLGESNLVWTCSLDVFRFISSDTCSACIYLCFLDIFLLLHVSVYTWDCVDTLHSMLYVCVLDIVFMFHQRIVAIGSLYALKNAFNNFLYLICCR